MHAQSLNLYNGPENSTAIGFVISVNSSTYKLVCDVYCDFVTFPFGVLGQIVT